MHSKAFMGLNWDDEGKEKKRHKYTHECAMRADVCMRGR